MTQPVKGRPPLAADPCRFQRGVYRANATLYLGWHTIALAKAGAYGATIAAFYRQSRDALAGLGKAAMACSLLGSIAAIGEAGITAVVFVWTARKVYRLHAICEWHAQSHDLLLQYCEEEKMKRRGLKYDAGMVLPLQCGREYAMYQAASAQYRSAITELSATSIVFLRDTVIQGAGAGANMAALWNAARLSEVLHLVKCVVHVKAATIAAGAAGIACGIFHMVGGGLAIVRGNEAIKRATDKLKAISHRLQGRVFTCGDVGEAASAFAENLSSNKAGRARKYMHWAHDTATGQFSEAILISRGLLRHANIGAERALETARHHVRLGKLRVAYGFVAAAIGGGALVIALTIGATTPIGWGVGGLGALVAAGWLLYAWYRNKRYARMLRVFEGRPGRAALVEQAVRCALRAFDGEGNGNEMDPMARKLIKQTLLELGVTRRDFRALKFCRPEDKAEVRAAIQQKIRQRLGIASSTA